MAAVGASKHGTALRELGLRGEILVYQCVFNLRMLEVLVTVPTVEIPRCHNASVPNRVPRLTLSGNYLSALPQIEQTRDWV
jgi:hypothetical protein